MSRYISNEWFRAIHTETSHHIALLDQPPKQKPSNYKENLPVFYEDYEISFYYSLLRFLLYRFKEVWETPLSAKSEQQIFPGQFRSERRLLTSLWALVECIDALEDEEEDIEPKFAHLGADESWLEVLREFWTRDTDIYAHEKRDLFTPVWSFVAGRRVPEPPIKFKLAAALAAVQDNNCTIDAKRTETRPCVISEGHAATVGLRELSDDPIESISIRLMDTKFEASEAVEAVEEICEVGLYRTPPSSPVSDTAYKIWDSVKRCYREVSLLTR